MPATPSGGKRDAAVADYIAAGPAPRVGLCAFPKGSPNGLLEEAFARHGLVFAFTGYESLRNLHANVFDFYVLEYWLPDYSGVALCREIRKVDPAAPIVFCTFTDRDDARRRALNAGANAYLCQPVEAHVLRERVCHLLDRADSKSLLARREAELAADAEFTRRASAAASPAGQALTSPPAATERAARKKAYKAFIESGGTRASFERWWAQILATAWATHRLQKSIG